MKINDLQPILAIERRDNFDVVITKNGEYSIGFLVDNPEIYTLSDGDFDSIHKIIKNALDILPVDSLVHKQDWYVEDMMYFKSMGEMDYLTSAQYRDYNERLIQQHLSFLYITMTNGEIKSSNNILSRRGLVKETHLSQTDINNFTTAVSRFQSILNDSGFFTLTPLRKADYIHETQGLLPMYLSLNIEPKRGEIYFDNDGKIYVNTQRASIYSVLSENDFGDEIMSAMPSNLFSADSTPFYRSFTAPIGSDLNFNHIYNQYYFITDQQPVLAKLELEKNQAETAKENLRNEEKAKILRKFIEEYTDKGLKAIYCHFNVIAWEQTQEDRQIDKKIVNAFKAMGIHPYLNGVESSPSLFWSGIPCNGGDLPKEDRLLLTTNEAICMFCNEGDYKPNKSGIVLFDRRRTLPVMVDLFHEPYDKGQIGNRNGIVIAPSGSGKSVAINYFVMQEIQNNFDIVIIDVGKSYKKLHLAYKELGVKTTFIEYDEHIPITFNPFTLYGKIYGFTEKEIESKMEFLINLMFLLWKANPSDYTKDEYSIISEMIGDYFQYIKEQRNKIFPCFSTYYDFVRDIFWTKLKTTNRDKLFNMDSYLNVNKQFTKGGRYEVLLNSKDLMDLSQDRFIVFELDKIQNQPLLYPLVTMLIMETIFDKMEKRKGIDKRIYLDEAWTALERAGMEKFVLYLYKTIRKFDGSIYAITQDILDIKEDRIINNSDIKIFLDHTRAKSTKEILQKRAGLLDKEIHLLYSIANNFNESYSELLIKLGDKAKIYRIKLSKELLSALKSNQKDNVSIYKDYEATGSMKYAILNDANKN